MVDSPLRPGETTPKVDGGFTPTSRGSDTQRLIVDSTRCPEEAALNAGWLIFPAVHGKRQSAFDGGFSPLTRGSDTLTLVVDSPGCPGKATRSV